jgi:hypothetical protein
MTAVVGNLSAILCYHLTGTINSKPPLLFIDIMLSDIGRNKYNPRIVITLTCVTPQNKSMDYRVSALVFQVTGNQTSRGDISKSLSDKNQGQITSLGL